ncbi:MAG: 4Fe-4S dicluster domain-containing protein [Clostridia bacterium]|nr:4Fe-4S dicluster domain-containing protein [Clostridia bacterium]
MALRSTGGIVLPKTKNPSKDEILLYDCPALAEIRLPELCAPVVEKGEYVRRYQKVACGEDGFSVYASIPGKVTVCAKDRIIIENDMSQKTAESDANKPRTIDDINYESLIEYSRRYGITGAYSGVPLYRKISGAYGKCSRIIINCIESDPYSGHVRALVCAHAKEIVLGAKILMIGMGVKKCVFALGASYSAAASAIKEHISDVPGMVIAGIKEKYPVGNEYLLLNAVYGKEISRSRSTAESGYPVFSAETVCELFNALRSGLPSIYKVLTVAGKGFSKPYAVRVPQGCAVADLADFIGTTEKFDVSFAFGGPLRSVPVDRGSFLERNTNMLLAYKSKKPSDGTCIRCARCTSFCPMDLVPFLFHDSYSVGRYSDVVGRGLYNCIECGICTYVCVGKIDLLAEIRAQKSALNAPEELAEEQPETISDTSDENAVSAEEEKPLDHESSAEEILDAVADGILSSISEDEVPVETVEEAAEDTVEEAAEEHVEETAEITALEPDDGKIEENAGEDIPAPAVDTAAETAGETDASEESEAEKKDDNE